MVTLSATSYPAGKPITVTVANRLDRTIYVDDLQSDCSIVILEQRSGSGWQPLTGCRMKRMSRAVAIDSGQAQTVTIDPHSFNFGGGPTTSEPALGAGLYRIKLAYRLTARLQGAEPPAVYSRTFAIGS